MSHQERIQRKEAGEVSRFQQGYSRGVNDVIEKLNAARRLRKALGIIQAQDTPTGPAVLVTGVTMDELTALLDDYDRSWPL